MPMLSQLYWSSYYTNNSRCGLTSMRICRVKGRSIDDVLTIKNSEIAKHLSLPPVKLHCSMLAEDAIKAAVKDIQKAVGSACPFIEARDLAGAASESKVIFFALSVSLHW